MDINILKQLAIIQEEGEEYFIENDIAYKGDKNDERYTDWEEVEEYDEGDSDYKVYTDLEADIAWDEELEGYINECIFPEISERYRMYFDSESWKRDAEYDGRGHALARYDGIEREQKVEGETFYLYKQ